MSFQNDFTYLLALDYIHRQLILNMKVEILSEVAIKRRFGEGFEW